MKIVLVGNCQVGKLSEIIPLLNRSISICHVKQVHIPDQSDMDKTLFFQALEDADVILTHKVNDDYYLDYVRTKFLLTKYRDKIKTVTNFWFNGYDPSYMLLKNAGGKVIEGPLGPNFFYHIVSGYCLG